LFLHTKSKDFPTDIPASINRKYKKEFEGFGVILGTGIANRFRKYRSYNEAKEYAQSLKLKWKKEWREYTQSKNFPKDIPVNPSHIYKKEFEGFGVFLGTGFVHLRLRKYRSYNEAKKYAQSLKLKTSKEWFLHTKSKDFPKDIPVAVYNIYKKEFEGFGVFLGNRSRKFRSYNEARKYAQSLKLNSVEEWYAHVKSKDFPKDIPISPSATYKKEFEGYGIFLGTGNKRGNNKKKK
jgi:hypothetical protein